MPDIRMARAARYAMGTRFEIVLYGDQPGFLKAAGEEALNEITRLDAQLSIYREDSDLSDLNARAAYEAVSVDPRLLSLLQHAQRLSVATAGAFDITIAPLLRCWGFIGGTGQMPDEDRIAESMGRVGMQYVILDDVKYTVRFERLGMMLDLGAIGKGYAIDQAVDLLRENGITSAILHGGTSSVYAIGAPPGADGWKIAIQRPFGSADAPPLTTVVLRDQALSVSAPHGKWFLCEGRRYGHVIDPRTGRPANYGLLAAIISGSATDGDALSTALLVRGPNWLPELKRIDSVICALVATESVCAEFETRTSEEWDGLVIGDNISFKCIEQAM